MHDEKKLKQITISLDADEIKTLESFKNITNEQLPPTVVIHKLIDTYKPKPVTLNHGPLASSGFIYCTNCGKTHMIIKEKLPKDIYCIQCGQHMTINPVNWTISEE